MFVNLYQWICLETDSLNCNCSESGLEAGLTADRMVVFHRTSCAVLYMFDIQSSSSHAVFYYAWWQSVVGDQHLLPPCSFLPPCTICSHNSERIQMGPLSGPVRRQNHRSFRGLFRVRASRTKQTCIRRQIHSLAIGPDLTKTAIWLSRLA